MLAHRSIVAVAAVVVAIGPLLLAAPPDGLPYRVEGYANSSVYSGPIVCEWSDSSASWKSGLVDLVWSGSDVVWGGSSYDSRFFGQLFVSGSVSFSPTSLDFGVGTELYPTALWFAVGFSLGVLIYFAIGAVAGFYRISLIRPLSQLIRE